MSIRVVTGLPHNGKGVWLADRVLFILSRNKKWFKKTGVVRKIYSNVDFSESFLKKNKGWIEHWSNLEDLIKVRGADVFVDEMGIYFDATRWADLSVDLKAWLFAHEHYGVEIYGSAQDFAQIDVAVRRLTTNLQYSRKLFGSRRPHPTKPKIKFIWGLIAFNKIPRKEYTRPANEYSDYTLSLLSSEYMWIRKRNTVIYDTLQEFKESKLPPLRHVQRVCLTCGKVHIKHI